MTPEQANQDRRSTTRAPGPRTVTIRIPPTTLEGSAENLSSDGIYLLCDAEIRVEVDLPDSEESCEGVLIRVESIRDGEIGLAIRLDLAT